MSDSTLEKSARQLAAELRTDQRQRWLAGDCVPAETYLRELPELKADANAAVDLIYAEFLLRERVGPAPTVDEYMRRFPAYAELVKTQIELHQALDAAAAAPMDEAG